MSTKRQKGEADIGSTRTKKPKKKKESNNETEAASTRTKKPKKKKDGTKKEAHENTNEEKEKDAKSNRNDSYSNEAKTAMKQFTYQIVQSGLHQMRVQFNELKAFVSRLILCEFLLQKFFECSLRISKLFAKQSNSKLKRKIQLLNTAF